MKTWLLAVVALTSAGCMDSVDTLNEHSYQLTTDGVPSIVVGAGDAAFTLDILGQIDASSDHIGAHFWTSSQADPTAAIGDSGPCSHTTADVVGQHDVTCTFPAPGTYYLRGHMRYTPEEGEPINYWGPETMVRVVDLHLNATAGSNATVDEPLEFTLEIAGHGSATSDHIGAHFWTTLPEDPTAAFGEQAGGCRHTEGDVPATYTISCDWSEAGEYHVFGHLRLDDGMQQHNLWSAPFTVTVA